MRNLLFAVAAVVGLAGGSVALASPPGYHGHGYYGYHGYYHSSFYRPIIEVAPIVTVPAPIVTIPAPIVTVPAPVVIDPVVVYPGYRYYSHGHYYYHRR